MRLVDPDSESTIGTVSFIVAVEHGQQQKGFMRGEEVAAVVVLLIYIEYFVAVGVFLNQMPVAWLKMTTTNSKFL